ncbi:hypothetical protein JW898_03420 [Candidatus Woesearchaeota archaeon]|nr:hypothetical protein [Candidatus Woesearchaeota archaeon]
MAGIADVIVGIVGDNALEAYFSQEVRDAVASALKESGISREELSAVVDRLLAEGKAAGVIIAGVAKLESAGHALADRLKQQNIPVETSALIAALGDIGYAPAYNVISAYVNTPQTHHALIALALLDFEMASRNISEQVGYAVAELSGEVPVPGRGCSYTHPLMVTLDVIIGDSIEAVGVDKTAERLLRISLKRPEEHAFMEDAIKNATYGGRKSAHLIALYRQGGLPSSNV